MPRVPLICGSRVPAVHVSDEAMLLAPPASIDPIADVGAAVQEAVRYPLAGQSLQAAVAGARRVTVAVDARTLPFPAALRDPRREALAATLDALEESGVRSSSITIFLAGGLERRAGQRELEGLLPPSRAREFRGRVEVHDAGSSDLLPVPGGRFLGRPLLETDAVVTLSAAETVLHGGPATFLSGSDARTIRSAQAESLLEPSTSDGWRVALELEQAVGGQAPVIGVSVVLDHSRARGGLRAYPQDAATRAALARSWRRRFLGLLPGGVRARVLYRLGRDLNVAAVLAGTPSVAHAEALLRGISLRGCNLDGPLDAMLVPVPWLDAHRPRSRSNPMSAAMLALGLALRLWRGERPVRPGGTLILLHPFDRNFGTGAQEPFRLLFQALRETDGRSPGRLRASEQAAAADEVALAAYRSGAAAHPLLPYAEWSTCAAMAESLGHVIVAGCRDAAAARALGFVPSQSAATALAMADGLAGGRARTGILLGPPYPPLLVGSRAPQPLDT